MSDELNNIIEQASELEIKQMPRSQRADPGGLRAKRDNQDSLQLLEKAVRTPARVLARGFSNLEGAAGGRDGLIETLKYCPESSSAHKAARKLLEDAALADVNASIQALCFKNRVRFESLAVAFKDSLTAKLAVEAITRLAENSAEVFDQVSIHALDRYDDCPVCEGKKRVRRIGDNGEWAVDESGGIKTQLCYNCRGSGKTFKEHDVADRKLYLEIIGIIEKKGGVTVNNVQQNAVMGDLKPGDGSFERLVKAVDKAVGIVRDKEEPVLEVDCVVFEEESQNPG